MVLVTGTGFAYSQKGEKSLGLMAGFAGYNTSGYVDVNFQYSSSNHFRLAPDIGFVFKNNDKTGFLIDIDTQYPFKISKGINIYPLAGLAFNNWSYDGGGNETGVGLNLGGGLDFYLTSRLKLQLQAKYSLATHGGGVYAGLGVGYTF